jgi:hypothetical protein
VFGVFHGFSPVSGASRYLIVRPSPSVKIRFLLWRETQYRATLIWRVYQEPWQGADQLHQPDEKQWQHSLRRAPQ